MSLGFGTNLLRGRRFFAMSTSTPLLDLQDPTQLSVETIDEVAPRLRAFTQWLIDGLKDCNVEVETSSIYLLNSTAHPIEVPHRANGVPMQVDFDAVLPAGLSEPRARVRLRFDWGKNWHYVERGKTGRIAKFPTRRILFRCLREIQRGEGRLRIADTKREKQVKAEIAFTQLALDLKAAHHPEDPSIIKLRHVKIKRLDRMPTRVILMMNVPHEEALEILQTYPKK